MDFTVSTFVTILTVIGGLALIVSIITEVLKGVPILKKVPKNLQVIVISLLLSIVTYFAFISYSGTTVIWYYIVADVIAGFVVAYVALYGWDKLASLYKKFRNIPTLDITANTAAYSNAASPDHTAKLVPDYNPSPETKIELTFANENHDKEISAPTLQHVDTTTTKTPATEPTAMNIAADTTQADSSTTDTSATDNFTSDNFAPDHLATDNSATDNSAMNNLAMFNSAMVNSKETTSTCVTSVADTSTAPLTVDPSATDISIKRDLS